MPLTDISCKSFNAQSKSYKKSDEKGLYLEIMPNGSKYWRLKYRFNKKEKRLSIGVYPEISLKDARNIVFSNFMHSIEIRKYCNSS